MLPCSCFSGSNTLTYLCSKENVICLQPRRDKTSGFLEGEGGGAEARMDQTCVGVLLLENKQTKKTCAGICLLFFWNIVDMFS